MSGHLEWHWNTILNFKSIVGTGWDKTRMAASSYCVDWAGSSQGTTSAFYFCHPPSGSSFSSRLSVSCFSSFVAFHPITVLSSFSSIPFYFPEWDQDRFNPTFLTQPNFILPAWLWQIASALHTGAIFNLLWNRKSSIFSTTPGCLPNNVNVLLGHTC